MLRYAITDGSNLTGAGARWAAKGVDFVQVRAKDLGAGKLLEVVLEARAQAIESLGINGRTPKLLINGRADVAIAAEADGVHLTAQPDELTPEQVRRMFAIATLPAPLVSVSAHNLGEVHRAKDSGADLVLFAPVFEKRVDGKLAVDGVGLDALREACNAAGSTPVLALGGVTLESAGACIAAGAAGIAGIRLFR